MNETYNTYATDCRRTL